MSLIDSLANFFHKRNAKPTASAASSPYKPALQNQASYGLDTPGAGDALALNATRMKNLDPKQLPDTIDSHTANEIYKARRNTTPSPFPSASPSMRPTARPTTGASPVANIDSFLRSISTQESGGSYEVRNKDTGAIGKYQIMPSNWTAWTKEAGIPGAPPTPQNQEKVARFKIQQYYDKYGNWGDVASVWYSGRPLSKVNANAPQGNYPSIGHYVESVLSRLHK